MCKSKKIGTIIFTILFLFGIKSHTLLAQKSENKNTISIEATVLDKGTKEPLPFTNVIIEGTSIGTITNEKGEFELTLTKNYSTNTVIFSFVGYQNTAIPVKQFKNPEKLIYLETASTSLEEIVVTVKNKYKELVDEAITLIPKNYAQEPVNLEAYYRELTKIDNTYTKFSDAASSIYYSPYDNTFDALLSKTDYQRFNRLEFEMKKVPYPEPQDFVADSKDRTKIIALRRSNNLQDYKIMEQSKKLKTIDTADLKWLENNEIGGGPLRLTGADKVKRKEDFLDPKTIDNYLFTLYGRSIYNDKPVYIISFAPKDSTSVKAKYKGEITIDEKSKAIIRYQYQLTSLAKKKLNQKFGTQLKTPLPVEKETKKAFITRTTSLTDYKVFVSFSNYKNKWYLKRIKAINEYQNTGDLFENYTATTESELIVTTVKTENIDYFSVKEQFDSTFSNALFNHNLLYSPDFWKNYSTLVPTGIVGKALEDLGAKISLEEQFQEKK
ncbi:carboxypeptidase-like regulatory domain-containing protein [uncultured Aquimarina sp.]|uniref:carboxypeptidase-like regulatory domain-containing protein n=1 Tax=uncultured Aquimarina sp. TaxID=575652 RepID=UPI00263576CF|nr:carboxypeptidase-like regulatory domain-containing protein [uncultured Aquimarina sp.]